MENILTIHCKSCGAPAEFNIIEQNYWCRACNTATSIEESMTAIDMLREKFRSNEEYQKQSTIYECSKCGAKVVPPKDSVLSTCDFCSAKIVGREMIETEYFPETIIPFFITLEEAKERIKDWANKNKKRPESEKLLSNINGLQG